ncbi:uncharacterized protein LOC121405516 [Drosophila obscura]|uniref:uncharacterized protein LOC121405516 n=1 Tax=Drosophila obscura TaxID=7282 RepID=UPI001BB2519F|nr:uncharacterized protein LOC121405516 [Drosophila obscura]
MANKPKIAKSKPRSSVVARRVKKPNPVRLRSLGDLNELEKARVASALDAAANLATENLKEKKENLNDFLPDDIESLQSESKKKLRHRVATAMKLLNFVEGFEDSDSDDITTPVSLSQVLVRHRNRSAIRSLAAINQENNGFCSNCLLRCRSCGRRNLQKCDKK